VTTKTPPAEFEVTQDTLLAIDAAADFEEALAKTDRTRRALVAAQAALTAAQAAHETAKADAVRAANYADRLFDRLDPAEEERYEEFVSPALAAAEKTLEAQAAALRGAAKSAETVYYAWLDYRGIGYARRIPPRR
jgi:hypothetical protein